MLRPCGPFSLAILIHRVSAVTLSPVDETQIPNHRLAILPRSFPARSLDAGRLWQCIVVRAVAIVACLVLAASHARGAPPDGNSRTAYFTVGDAQDLLEFPPLDSRTSIAAAFESLKTQYAVDRIWWRGAQDEIWGKEFVIRPENRGDRKSVV